jgi:hypothetical protein
MLEGDWKRKRCELGEDKRRLRSGGLSVVVVAAVFVCALPCQVTSDSFEGASRAASPQIQPHDDAMEAVDEGLGGGTGGLMAGLARTVRHDERALSCSTRAIRHYSWLVSFFYLH